MLALLFERMAQWPNKEQDYKVGDVLEKNLELAAPKYELYSLLWEEIRPTFMNEKTDLRSKNFPYKFWTNVAKFESGNNIKMEAFLEQISQRIPFMARVIKDITKITPQDNADYQVLENVYKKIKKLSEKILELKEDAHQQEKMRNENETDQVKKSRSTASSIRKALTLGAEKNKKIK